MNRYLGLSGALHVGLVAGLLYLGAKNDFSPHKLIESFTLQTDGETTAEASPLSATAQVTGAGQKSNASDQVIDDSFVDEALSDLTPKKAIQKQVAAGHKTVLKMNEKPSAIVNSAKENHGEEPRGKTSQNDSLENTQEIILEKSEQKIESMAAGQGSTETKSSDEVSEDQSSAEIQERQESEEKEFFAAAPTEETVNSTEKTETQNQDSISEQDQKQILAQKKALLEDLRRQNAEKEAQEAAALAYEAKNSSSHSDSSKETGSSADGSAGKVAEGSGGPAAGETVHALADFKQTAGNPKPRYDREDRMKNRSGTVTFQAFVKKDGSLDEFQMIESSGHRTLDAKTLRALKQWKFAAGQQGWIEIPFRWDLKGGVQEMPSLRSSMKE